ncbi:4Fe-4S dicluster domain-containing protein [Pseudobacteriovorax antillogorgiicola]|uniref:Prokaryotic molybdopterin-containing oxidoreductase family, iron-sulfur binding subunit n=1 Tax=Pseudobacteriovorax antillogorgiicola TaxID=1513793 RepID=A0A1Y6C2A6_9BACT|nr:4Fe-4S dicluster domain-containing protein [Pseudobacteriovorax antillogorgiicola]TCS50255.1 quinol:cytochrome c oxidoreductase iron-sulfur protein precursor [Pseudobacteriovorax antillogorgiicola]SMF32979.1 prokaryotic molybdopterin-containing oxidoreductase family, iron-sulfur binding subunit [Pseudobacteriovorax antillogorgiicola]
MRSNDRDLRHLEEQKEAFLHGDQPFEAPAKELVPGPYYSNIEEVVPELGEGSDGQEADQKKLAVDRRDFMRLFSAGAVMASTAACVRRPVEKSIPHVDQPIDQILGVPTYYATTVDGAGVVVKTREGRPVFIEGNRSHPLSQGAASSLAMSELQALYHPDRRKAPVIRYGTNRESESSWDDVYSRLAAKLKDAQKVGILLKSTTGHSLDFYKDFLKAIGQSEDNLYLYDSNSLRNNMAAAYKLAFGEEGYPRTDLKRSELIVGVGSDFMDLGASSIYETKSWSDGHSYRFGQKGRFVQFESRLTMTGGAAEERYPIAPGNELGVTLALVKALLNNSASKGSAADKANIQTVLDAHSDLIQGAESSVSAGVFTDLAKDLLTSKSVVLVGESSASTKNGTLVQLAGIFANVLIGSYENKTLVYNEYWMTAKGGDDTKRFLDDAKSFDALFVINVNPAFTLPESTGIRETLKNIGTVVSIQSMPCETDAYAEFILNGHNILETWGDEHLVHGFWSMVQPTVSPFTNSQQAEDILLWVAAHLDKPMGVADYRNYLRKKWMRIHKEHNVTHDFDTFFNAVLRKGLYGKKISRTIPSLNDVSSAFANAVPASSGLKLVAHLDHRLIDGVGADRPVLQEAGDALTTVTWDTWVAISPDKARELGFKYNDLVTVKGPAGSFEAAVYPMPGLHNDVVAVPRGNGHADGVSRVSTGIGVDPLQALAAEFDVVTGEPVTSGQAVELVATGRKYRLAAMQKHNDIANRTDILKEVGLDELTTKEKDKVFQKLDDVPDLFPELKAHPDYRWGMSIDLDKCNGCGACTVACDLENNIPQVGREQILLGREMHWMRIDRYFKGAVENPEVSFQPVACQHCNHAPCEAVCPVYATVHDEEGMNNQTYNRCVGTRYCANACPYKVRRFNWFTHKWNVMGDRPVDRNPRALNPDVTVRTRGVMEKCTYCVQRIRDAKHYASEQKRKVVDGEIRTACEVACASNAIVFGNLKDNNSRVARLRRNYRAFLMLGGDPMHGHYGIKTLPNTSYLAKVVRDPSSAHAKTEHSEGDHG